MILWLVGRHQRWGLLLLLWNGARDQDDDILIGVGALHRYPLTLHLIRRGDQYNRLIGHWLHWHGTIIHLSLIRTMAMGLTLRLLALAMTKSRVALMHHWLLRL